MSVVSADWPCIFSPVSGVTVKLFPSIDKLALPLIFPEKTRASSSTSFADKVYTKTPSSSIVWSDTKSIIGASFTGLTVNVNEVESESKPSVTVTTYSIVPLKSKSGYTVKTLSVRMKLESLFNTEKDSSSKSTSYAEKV